MFDPPPRARGGSAASVRDGGGAFGVAAFGAAVWHIGGAAFGAAKICSFKNKRCTIPTKSDGAVKLRGAAFGATVWRSWCARLSVRLSSRLPSRTWSGSAFSIAGGSTGEPKGFHVR